MAIRANALAVLAKAPIAGEVKTRLVPPLSYEQAAELSRALLDDLLAQVRKLGGVDRYLFFTPDRAVAVMKALAGEQYRLVPQRGADLGARMAQVFADLRARGHRGMVLIGGDLPVFPLDFLEQAFAWLDAPGDRVVLGPSRDGGYYLIGMNRPLPELFTGVTWSRPDVLRATLTKIASLPVEASQLPLWFDVDTVADLASLRQFGRESEPAMKNTLRVLRQIGFS